MDPSDLSDLTALVARDLPKLHHMEDSLLILVNDIVDLFGYRGYKWRQKSSIISVLLSCNIPFHTIQDRLSNYPEHGGQVTLENGMTYEVFCPRRMSVGKTKTEKLILLSPRGLQRLAFSCRKGPSLKLISSVVDVLNARSSELANDLLKEPETFDILKEAMSINGVFNVAQ